MTPREAAERILPLRDYDVPWTERKRNEATAIIQSAIDTAIARYRKEHGELVGELMDKTEGRIKELHQVLAIRDARITALRKAVRWVLDHPSQRIPAWVYEAME